MADFFVNGVKIDMVDNRVSLKEVWRALGYTSAMPKTAYQRFAAGDIDANGRVAVRKLCVLSKRWRGSRSSGVDTKGKRAKISVALAVYFSSVAAEKKKERNAVLDKSEQLPVSKDMLVIAYPDGPCKSEIAFEIPKSGKPRVVFDGKFGLRHALYWDPNLDAHTAFGNRSVVVDGLTSYIRFPAFGGTYVQEAVDISVLRGLTETSFIRWYHTTALPLIIEEYAKKWAYAQEREAHLMECAKEQHDKIRRMESAHAEEVKHLELQIKVLSDIAEKYQNVENLSSDKQPAISEPETPNTYNAVAPPPRYPQIIPDDLPEAPKKTMRMSLVQYMHLVGSIMFDGDHHEAWSVLYDESNIRLGINIRSRFERQRVHKTKIALAEQMGILPQLFAIAVDMWGSDQDLRNRQG